MKHLSKTAFSALQKQKVMKRYEHQVEPENEVLAAFVKGLGYEGITELLLLLNDSPCSKTQFYQTQAKMIEELYAAAKASCFTEFQNMAAAPISHDGQWSGRRNAQHCVVEFMNQNSKNCRPIKSKVIFENMSHTPMIY